MAYEFYLRHRDRAGATIQAVINPLSLLVTLSKYGGSVRFELNADDEAVSTFDDFDYVDVMWRNLELGIMDVDAASGRGFVLLIRSIYRQLTYDTDLDNQTIWVGQCQSKWSILTLRQVLYQNEVDGRTQFTNDPTETIGKEITKYNCTADASIANGRFREGDLAPGMSYVIALATDQGRGLVRNYRTGNGGTPATGGILKNVRDLASISDGEFRLDETAIGEYAFDYRDGQQGDDRYDDVIFSVERRNLIIPTRKQKRIGKATVAMAAGQGEAPNRLISDEQFGDTYAIDNDIEMFVDARDLLLVDSLNDRAVEKQYQNRPVDVYDFTISQTADTFFSNVDVDGRNTYNVGDAVQLDYFGQRRQIVAMVQIDWSSPVPRVIVATEDP